MKSRLGILLLFLVTCGHPSGTQPVEEIRFLMDTVVRISVYEQQLSEEAIHKAIDQAFQRMEIIESLASTHRDSSEVNCINRMSGRKPRSVSPEILYLLSRASEISRKTEGAFDATIGVIKMLWRFDSDQPQIPDPSTIHSHLQKVNYRNINTHEDQVFLKVRGMMIDLGGIAKGYIIDEAVKVLQKNGIRGGVVEAGGDLRLFGSHPERSTWRIGIKHPRNSNNDLIGVIETGATSIATSGDYERFFHLDEKRYHHILDPQTGYPAERCISVTIVTENALEADAYATAVFVMGPEKGMKWLSDQPTIEGFILYEEDGTLKKAISSGLKNLIQSY
jgi:thiamine biosynthesis lipoprotein